MRYAQIVHAQEEALESGDVARFEVLAGERKALQDTLDVSGEDPAEPGADPEEGAMSGEDVAEMLRVALASDRRIEARLRELRDGAAREIRDARRNDRAVEKYAAPATDADPPGRIHVDFTL